MFVTNTGGWTGSTNTTLICSINTPSVLTITQTVSPTLPVSKGSPAAAVTSPFTALLINYMTNFGFCPVLQFSLKYLVTFSLSKYTNKYIISWKTIVNKPDTHGCNFHIINVKQVLGLGNKSYFHQALS